MGFSKGSLTLEQRKRMSEAQKRRFSNPEEIKKLSGAHKGQKGYWLGKKRSKTTIQKQRKSLIKYYVENIEARDKMRDITKNLWENTEFRKRQIEVRKGKHYSSKTEFKKGSSGFKGKHSEKTKRKISLVKKGIRASPKTEFKKGFTPWNVGKVYTEEERKVLSEATKKGMANSETRRKLRANTLKMYESGSFPKQTNTKPERQIKEELIKRGYKEEIDFIHQYKFRDKFMCDFCFPNKKVIIEVDGDFWHANPNKYAEGNKLHKHQIKGIKRDRSKNAYISKVDNGSWRLLRFWESDIKENVIGCVNNIEKVLNK